MCNWAEIVVQVESVPTQAVGQVVQVVQAVQVEAVEAVEYGQSSQ
jgi:hypothetical protein